MLNMSLGPFWPSVVAGVEDTLTFMRPASCYLGHNLSRFAETCTNNEVGDGPLVDYELTDRSDPL